ncbi:MAG: ATP-binding protein [Clostridia bacterium]|nr:ATP-binding protein [Clostridia bacterium]
MELHTSDSRLVSRLLFRLLPIQILLAAVGAVNGIVSSLFASNYVGVEAMTAVGLYAPATQLLGAISLLLVGGSQILCGQYMGKDQKERMKDIFSLDILISVLFSAVMILVLVTASLTDLTKVMTGDENVRPLFNSYILGQVLGILPLVLGQQLSAFLSLENQVRRTMIASIVFILVNLGLNYVFVAVLQWGAFGLALASSIGLWVFFLVQAQYYMTKKAILRFGLRGLHWKDFGEILKIGLPGSLSQGYQTIRRLLVNALVIRFVGSIGLSAFTASDTLLGIIWSIPAGMLAVSRMMISVSTGEEDRQSLIDVMRTMFYKFLPVMAAVSALLIICAKPLTGLYYQDPSDPVYMMTVWGFRILPLCMPLSIISMHFVCYGQTSSKQGLVHILSVLDGVVCVAGFSAILVPMIGINGVYISNVLNGVVTTVVIILYSWILRKKFPRNVGDLMVIPDSFGVPAEERMDLTLRSMEDVVDVSRQVQAFCREKGLDDRRSYLAGLFMEEMAGNIVDHGFTKDRKHHSVDARVVHKGEELILRLKDDCIPFDPSERQKVVDPDDVTKNIGIRMVYAMAEEIRYQTILGLNVLTIRI